jgi:alkanesulfonate monooxygenase SsuD/methylene tetrahydromethanopterin reductase-like flavin-dependent oxidoreductase (luciferase family)
MKFGIDIPNHGPFSDPQRVIDLAQMAEESGWDGFFIWDHLLRHEDVSLPMIDPWIALTAVAARTKRVKLGPMVTPLARRRPWIVAREAVTLDHLSGGRLILGVGLGARSQVEFGAFGDPADPRQRAEVLDESLEILSGLWHGERFEYRGAHYHIEPTQFRPTPVQKPRIPIWVAGVWPHKKPFERAARWDGAVPIGANRSRLDMLTSKEITDLAAFIHKKRESGAPFELVNIGITPGGDPEADAAILMPYAQAGVTWWFENLDLMRGGVEMLQKRVLHGPPHLPSESYNG